MTYHATYSPRFTNLPDNGKLYVPENQKFVIDVNSVDNARSEGNGIYYSIVGGIDAEFFTIDETTGVLEFKNPPDFENDQSIHANGDNIYDVTIKVLDAGGYSSQKSLWIHVTDVDENVNTPPTFTNLPADGILMIDENNTFVIDSQSTDDSDSEGSGIKYSIVGGVDSEFFDIDMTTGELSFKTPPDFENDQSNFGNGDNVYDVAIRVEDSEGLFTDKSLWVKVKDVDEPVNTPPTFTNLPADGMLMIDENNTFVIDAQSTDDSDSEGNGIKYSIVGGIDAEFFDIDMTTGELSFKNPPDFENDQSIHATGDNVYDVAIRVEDSEGLFTDKSLWVKVKDVDSEDPILSDGTYQLCNHPDGAAASPHYGLRLDGLTTGDANDIFTFNFEHPDADMRITIDGDTVRIFGVAFGGLDVGEEYDPNNSGLWEVDFTYDNVTGLEGDDDLTVGGLNPKSTGTNTGTIKQLYGPGETFDLTEYSNMDGSSFFLGDEPDEQGHRGFDGISGRGWFINSGVNERAGASDWLFTVKPEPLTTGLGDTVFLDADRDGVQDPDEAGVEGVTVTITGAGADGDFDTADDIEVVTTTNADGNYASGNLDPGDYKVTFSDLPAGLNFTDPDQGGNEATDSDADPITGMTDVITLNGGDVNNDIDAGLVTPISPGRIGDKVFLDADRDGVQDPDEVGVEGVTVTINGPGADGILGTGDDTIEVVTTTDADGNYDSGDLAPGDYKVTFSDLPAGLDFTTANQGGDDALDSDADPTTGMSDVITIGEGEINNTVDAGLVAPISPARLGNRVFDDRNQNGVQDNGEAGVAGVTVTLTGGGADGLLSTLGDNTEESKVTNQRGLYSFRDLTPGEYKVTFSDLPNGFEFTAQDQGGNDVKDSDADVVTGMTDIVVLQSGDINNTIDAGIFLALTPPEKNSIRGTIASDFLSGTVAADDIRGLGESDTLRGFDGNDCLYGNGGFDLIRGGNGADEIFGGQQGDTLFGEGGNDIISGGTGNDSLLGGGGNDTLDGTNGSGANELDTLSGGAGSDVFILGDANSAYYVASGAGDFATIQGFSSANDTIQLTGSVGDYETQQNGSDLELLSNGELIAVFQGTNNLDLNAVGSFV